MAALYVNTHATKATFVARTQVLTLTDGNGLERQFVYPDITTVEPGGIISLSDAEIATLDPATHLEPAPPT